MESPAVEIIGLVKRYGGITAVDGLTLRAERGAVTAVLGPNGAGKTSTVEICEGFRRADAGTVRVLGLIPTLPEL
jgi:ABC-2 type transport system ATP-binding protein